MKIIEFYDRALSGRRMEERVFDTEVLPGKLKELIKKYDISYKPDEAVPQDLSMAKRIFDAAVELITGVGIYCRDTNSIITIEEEEVRSALRDAPTSHVIGEGAEAVECYSRGLDDKRRPRVIGGVSGNPLPEESFMEILTNYANEPVDGLHTGAMQTLFGRNIRAGDPLELLAGKYEALWAREAIRRAGKPGLAILGIMSAVTSEGQCAGDFEGGLRPCDLHLVVFANDLKVNWEDFKKIVHHQYLGNAVEACCLPMLGGYSGGPEGTVITAVAEVIQGYVMAKPVSFAMTVVPLSPKARSQSLWLNCMSSLAFISAGVDIILAFYTGGGRSRRNELFGDGSAARDIALTASGASVLYGARRGWGSNMDYSGVGLGSRILYEMSQAAAGIKLEEANEIVGELTEKYAYELPAEDKFIPLKEQLVLWEKEKKELQKMGLVF